MNQFAVVCFPKIDIDKIQRLRERYDPQFKVILPHITLVSPFLDIEEEKIVEHLNSIAKNVNSFPIHLNGLMKSFDNYLFLLVQEGKKEIEKIHEELYSGILEEKFTTDIPFIPHITLGVYSEQAFKEANESNLDFNCNFGSIALIKGDGISPAIILQNFFLIPNS